MVAIIATTPRAACSPRPAPKRRRIAHWTKVKRQQLADVPTLATTVQSRVIYGVQRRVESQIVADDGTGENCSAS